MPLLFDVLLHLSTLAAVGVVFRHRLAELAWRRRRLVAPAGAPPRGTRRGPAPAAVAAADYRGDGRRGLRGAAPGGSAGAALRGAHAWLATAALLVTARVLRGAASAATALAATLAVGAAGGRSTRRCGAAGHLPRRCHHPPPGWSPAPTRRRRRSSRSWPRFRQSSGRWWCRCRRSAALGGATSTAALACGLAGLLRRRLACAYPPAANRSPRPSAPVRPVPGPGRPARIAPAAPRLTWSRPVVCLR